MKPFKSKISAGLAFALLAVTACGSDSTGPSNLDAESALKSLAIGLQQMGTDGSTATLAMDQSFGGIAPFLNQVNVNIDGSSQTMFGLGLHESFPDGTCWETIFSDVVPADPATCTPPQLGVSLMLWQSHSASEPPDRIVVLAGDVGTSDFNFDLDSPNLLGVALYLEGQNNLWVSQSGTLTSAVSASSQNCDIPLPLYAKSGHCNIATFDEQGSIVLNQVNDLYSINSSGPTKTLMIPRQTLHGLWMAITEVQPIGLTAARLSPRTLFQRLSDSRVRR
jgi:hypothetical protein